MDIEIDGLDLLTKQGRETAEQLVGEADPLFSAAGLPCTAWCSWNRLRTAKDVVHAARVAEQKRKQNEMLRWLV
eukprot:13454569-Alexandrium_andersonii.AAC.1